jgi:hypothetical protein
MDYGVLRNGKIYKPIVPRKEKEMKIEDIKDIEIFNIKELVTLIKEIYSDV